jgi:hypothetical protein
MNMCWYQFKIAEWISRCFGKEVFYDHEERGRRFIEEAVELNQAIGVSKEDILRIVDHVYSRPVGDVFQEIGGVGITLLGLCQSVGYNFEAATQTELDKVEALPTLHFRKRHIAKAEAGISMMPTGTE